MNLPNKLTVFRMILVPVFLAVAMIPFDWGAYAAVGVFTIAMLTDKLDGDIARKRNLITDFGKFMDPIADKLLVTGGMLVLLSWGRMYVWSVFVILAREFLVSALRMMEAKTGKVVAASWWGKIKTTLQNIGIIVLLLPFTNIDIWFTDLDMIINVVITVFTVISAFDYFKGAGEIFKDK